MTIKEIFDYENKYEYGKDKKFHISGINSCRRKMYLTMKGLYKEKLNSKTLRNFSLGNLFHTQARSEIFEKSGNCGFDVVAAEVSIPEQPLISGKIDLIVSDKKTGELIVVDIKSAGDYTINQVENGHVSDGYINQVQLYLHFLKIKRGFLLFFGKHKGQIVEFEVLYDKAHCEKLIAEIENFMINNVEKNIEPQKCDGGDWGCDACGVTKQWK